MAWRIVKQPNGYYARFSEVVDNFTHYDMTREFAFAECLELDMTPNEAEEKVRRADENPNRFNEAITIISSVHGVSVAKKFEGLLREPDEGDSSS